MTAPTAQLSSLHSPAFNATKALQNRHKGGGVQFSLPPAGTASATPGRPAAASSPGNLVSGELLAHLAQQKK